MFATKGYWKGRRVLVTGATGFLGGWLVRALADDGAEIVTPVRGADRPSQFNRAGLAQRCDVRRGTLSEPAFVASLFDDRPYAAVFHTAAVADVRVAIEDPVDCFRSAFDSTLAILEQARTRHRGTAVVVSSSDKAYGPQATPYREESGLKPNHPYEVAKALQDMMGQSYGKVLGLKVAVTRCANYFGGWEMNLTRIVPDAVLCAIENRPLVLRSDGRFTRDFLHVEEGAEIQLGLAERLLEGADIAGEAFNFSYEVELEILELVERVFAAAGHHPGVRVDNSAKAEIRHMRVDTTKARERLGWRPRMDLDAALRSTVDWYRAFRAGA